MRSWNRTLNYISLNFKVGSHHFPALYPVIVEMQILSTASTLDRVVSWIIYLEKKQCVDHFRDSHDLFV